MNVLDGVLRTELSLFVLECGRISGLLITAPLAWSHAPNRVKVVLALLLTLVAHGQATNAVIPDSPLMVASALVVELGIGLSMGFVVRLVVAIAEIYGEVVSPAIGLGMASAFDPTTQSQSTQISTLLRHLMVLLALTIGVHRVLLGALLVGFRALPVGTSVDLAAAFPNLLSLSSATISVGVRIALPLVAILFMIQIALAFIARAAPQVQVFNVGFAVMLAVGLSILSLLLPDTAAAFVIELSFVGVRIEELLAALGARL